MTQLLHVKGQYMRLLSYLNSLQGEAFSLANFYCLDSIFLAYVVQSMMRMWDKSGYRQTYAMA